MESPSEPGASKSLIDMAVTKASDQHAMSTARSPISRRTRSTPRHRSANARAAIVSRDRSLHAHRTRERRRGVYVKGNATAQ